MFSKNKISSAHHVPTNILLSADKQLPAFHRINLEYFFLYHGIKQDIAKEAIFRGLSNNFIGVSADHQHKATKWKTEQDKILDTLTSKLFLEIKRQLKQQPITALRRLPSDIRGVQQILAKTPNDHLCHFHLAWLYSISKNHAMAERHFNVAALQSQSINPQFACFTYRHLANARLKSGKFSQALLAIEAACELCQSFDPELQLERIRLLSRAQRTTQALPHLASLIDKAPHYEHLAFQDADIQKNPSLRRVFNRRKEHHIQNIQHQLFEHWKNDPLHLLNLDRELGQEGSIKILQGKQRDMLLNLPSLLIFDEQLSSQLIQKHSHSTIMRSLDIRKQRYIQNIEDRQECAGKVHQSGQWMLYAAVLSLIALGLSYAISTIAYQFNYHWPINLYVQSIVLGCAIGLVVVGVILLRFTPHKLDDLLRQKQKLEDLSLRFGVSTG